MSSLYRGDIDIVHALLLCYHHIATHLSPFIVIFVMEIFIWLLDYSVTIIYVVYEVIASHGVTKIVIKRFFLDFAMLFSRFLFF